MRKGLMLFVTVILIVLLALVAFYGINTRNVAILSYKQIESKSNELNIQINTYENKNKKELKEKEQEILTQIQNYDKQKQEYERVLKEKESNLANVDVANISDIDFLLIRIGNYATEHNLNLIFNVTKNSADKNATEYILTDLNFEVTGEYNEIADYINDLEKDERLEFEIRDFKMVDAGGITNSTKKDNTTNEVAVDTTSKVKATFKVYRIAINRNTITELSTTATEVDNTISVNDTTATE